MDNRLNGLELDENIETVFKVEPPLTPTKSNFGYQGVLLRDIKEDKIQCHICGKWFKGLNRHILAAHKITTKEYKKEYSLPPNFPLIARSTSSKKSNASINNKNGLAAIKKYSNMKKARQCRTNMKYYYTTEAYKNMHGLCDKQIESRYLIVADIVGNDPSKRDLEKYDSPLLWAMIDKYKSLNNFREAFGFGRRNEKFTKRYTEDMKIAELRKFYNQSGRIPRVSDFRIRIPSDKAILRHFGSWNRALEMAGFNKLIKD